MKFANENGKYLTEQIITYIGNKRALLAEIDSQIRKVKRELGKEKITSSDVFSGSGIVARLLKHHSSHLVANDLEAYSYIINSCYLSNKSEFDSKLFNELLEKIQAAVNERPIEGVITNNYAPHETDNVKEGERCFYTHENAILIDSYRYYIDSIVPEDMKKYFLARLLVEASIHTNTSGVFKGFYKNKKGIGQFGGEGRNALTRILGEIQIDEPILSNYECEYTVYQKDTNELVRELPLVDLAYIDPPYDQHPFGSNYFMLNLILKNEMPENISVVSGIPTDWNRSAYNKEKEALAAMEDLIANINARYVLISYNNEGFIGKREMENMLRRYGRLRTKSIKYNAFRGSRNLSSRSTYTNEFLFLLRKDG